MTTYTGHTVSALQPSFSFKPTIGSKPPKEKTATSSISRTRKISTDPISIDTNNNNNGMFDTSMTQSFKSAKATINANGEASTEVTNTIAAATILNIDTSMTRSFKSAKATINANGEETTTHINGKWCSYCQMNNHNTEDCCKLNDSKPAGYQYANKKPRYATKPSSSSTQANALQAYVANQTAKEIAKIKE
jgi:hypothetical protein